MEDKVLTWRDESGEYKIGYSQKLQEDNLKALKLGNNLKLILVILLVLIALGIVSIIIQSELITRVGQRIFCP